MDEGKTFKGKIGIVGSGALGGFYGARLARAGFDVHFLMRRDFEAVRSNGLKVQSFEGDFEIRPSVHGAAVDIGSCDLVIVGLKTTDNAALSDLLAHTATRSTLVLTLQNGLGNEEAIVAALMQNLGSSCEEASRQVLGGIAFICSNRIAPGVISHTAHGWIRLANFTGEASESTRAIAAMFGAAGIDCVVFDSLKQIRWEKLVWNVPFNGLGVAAGHAHTAAILADPTLLRTTRTLMEEVLAGAAADGAALDPEIVERMIKSTYAMGEYRTSMQIDYEERRRLEVEAILGEPVRRALAGGAAVPAMEMLYGIVARLDLMNQ